MVTSQQELMAAQARAREIEASIDDPITAAIIYEFLLALLRDQLIGYENYPTQLPAQVDDLRAYQIGEQVWLDIDYTPNPGWSGPGAQTVAVQRNESDLLPLNTSRTGSGNRTVPINPTLPGQVVISFMGPKGVDGQAPRVANHAFTLGQTLAQTASDSLAATIEERAAQSQTEGFFSDRLRYQIQTLSAQVLSAENMGEGGISGLQMLSKSERYDLQQYLIYLHEMLTDVIRVKPIADLTDELHLLAELTTTIKTVNQSIEK